MQMQDYQPIIKTQHWDDWFFYFFHLFIVFELLMCQKSSYVYQFTVNYCYTTIPQTPVISWYLGCVLKPMSSAVLLVNCYPSQSD